MRATIPSTTCCLMMQTAIMMVCPTLAAAGDADDRLPDDPAAEAAMIAAVGDRFRVRVTPHFFICYDADNEVLAEFIARVESTYRGAERFLRVHDIDGAKLKRRLEIYFFERHEDFLGYAGSIGTDASGAAGFYHPASNRAAFFNALNGPGLARLNAAIAEMERQLRESRGNASRARSNQARQLQNLRSKRDAIIETTNQLVVQHEVAHQVFYNVGLHARRGSNPTWLVEGLACLMESPPDRNGAGFGTVNQYRLVNFRQALAGARGPRRAEADQFAEACRAERLVPLRRLLTEPALFDTGGDAVDNIYAQTWSLVHFLQRKRREDFGVYLTVLSLRPADRGYSSEAELMLFERVFGPIDEEFRRAWLDFILDERVRYPQ